ncbi:MAG: hypothetical protein PVJ27_04095 [Candidatus Brocadiaceae bacterium]
MSVLNQWDDAGRVSLDNGEYSLIFAKDDVSARVYHLSKAQPVEVMSLAPRGADGETATGVSSCNVLAPARNEARCQVAFSTETGSMAAIFGLDDRGAIRVQPAENLRAVSVSAAFAYGVLPSRHVDDNIYSATDYPGLVHLHIPSENLFVGLLEGQGRIIACAWPTGEQSVRLALGGDGDERRIESIELTLAGREAFINTISAPGIWHEVELTPAYEERDTALEWQPPFVARWKTQLSELGTPTTFSHLHSRRRQWRPTIAYYTYPFFSEGGNVILHLHKKLSTEGNALIYALEGHTNTPYSFVTRNLPLAEQRKMPELRQVEHYYVLDPDPIKGGEVMAAHCSGRDQLKYTTLTVGAYPREVPFLDTHISDRVHECRVILTYSIRRSLDCMDALDKRIEGWLQEEADDPGVSSFLRAVRVTLTAMREDYTGRLGGDTPEEKIRHVERMAVQFRSTIRQSAGRELCPEILFYINELNSIISLDEDEGRRFGTWGRKLFQQAGYACVGEPGAVQYAEQVRAHLREHLKVRQYESPRTSGYASALVRD